MMFTLIVGDLKNSELVIQDLKDNNHSVVFIDIKGKKDISEILLEENRIQFAQLFIAFTEEDHVNLYLCKLAKKKYGVEKTIALANYPDNMELLKQQNIDYVICPNLFIKNCIDKFIFRGEGKCI